VCAVPAGPKKADDLLLEGRFLGGRPPYGYTLKDLGPHPNPGKAADGNRLHGLKPDPRTAPVVQRIFAMYLATPPEPGSLATATNHRGPCFRTDRPNPPGPCPSNPRGPLARAHGLPKQWGQLQKTCGCSSRTRQTFTSGG
jgi:hypothetical protein